jgi:tetratricopeptide (TPR) repeat protein
MGLAQLQLNRLTLMLVVAASVAMPVASLHAEPDAWSQAQDSTWNLRIRRQWVQAEAAGAQALKLAEASRSAARIADSLSLLGEIYEDQSKFPAAEQMFLRAQQVVEQAPDINLRRLVTILGTLARVYKKDGRLDKAELVYLRELSIKEAARGGGSDFLTGVLIRLAQTYDEERKYDKAEQAYKRALELYEKSRSKNDPVLRPTLVSLAKLYRSTGRSEDAKACEKRLAAIPE